MTKVTSFSSSAPGSGVSGSFDTVMMVKVESIKGKTESLARLKQPAPEFVGLTTVQIPLQ